MLKYIFLGLVQGLTEFLPVSSSGHLVILQKILGLGGEELATTIILHLGTALALVIFFFKDILGLFKDKKLLGMVALVTVITGSIGLLGGEFFENLFSSVRLVAVSLMVTGIILIFTRKIQHHYRKNPLPADALILGVTQGIAIIPGISRSGITIATLLFRGLDRETSFKFSFLAAIPVIFAAFLLELKNIHLALNADFAFLVVGFVSSFLSGLLALHILKLILQKAKLHYFGYYCIIVACLTLLFVR